MLLPLLATARPPFLLLAPLCVSVAVAYAYHLGITLKLLDVGLCYFAALCAHASVNMLNEYHDHISGLDTHTTRTPFNGGSGALQRSPYCARAVKRVGLALLMMAIGIGLYFVVGASSYVLLALGLVATASVILYTPTVNKLPLICLIAPGFGFGAVFITGSFIALTDSITMDSVLLAIPVVLLTNNLLLLNQFPDKQADQLSGRRHLIIRYGDHVGWWVYTVQLLATLVASVLITLMFSFSYGGGLLFVPLLLAVPCVFGLKQYLSHQRGQALLPYQGLNVAASLSYPLILSILLIGY